MSSVTTIEAAEMLDVSPDTIRRMCNRGDIASWRTPGGHRRIPADAVHAILTQREATADE